MQNKKITTRRAFVKNSSMLAGGALTLPVFAKANYFANSDDVIKVAIIGCGGRGTGAAVQALSVKQNVKLVAMADPLKDKLDDCYAKLIKDEGDGTSVKSKVAVPEENKFTGFDGYKKAIALADVVLLTSPPAFRPLHFEEAVSKGKHVFMEKPAAVDPAGVRKVLDAAEKAKQKKLNVVVGLQRHYQNSYRELYANKNLIGDFVAGYAYWNMGALRIYNRKPEDTELGYQLRNWNYFTWLSGDHIVEQHVHNIDAVNWFKGTHPIKAIGVGGRQTRTGKDTGQIFDHHAVTFEYADGTYQTSQCRQQIGTASRVEEVIVGTKGKLNSSGLITDRSGATIFSFDGKKENNPYQTEHDELFDAVKKGDFKFYDATYAATSSMTAIIGRMATYSGQIIEYDKALNMDLNLGFSPVDLNSVPPVVMGPDGLYPVAGVPGKTKFI